MGSGGDNLGLLPEHPTLARLLRYWIERRGDRQFPARSDIDPVDFSYALGHVSLIDVSYDPLRFRYRLVGSRIAERIGVEMTGRWLDELPYAAYRQILISLYTRVVESRRPHLDGGTRVLDGRAWRAEALIMPLAADGHTIDMLLACRLYSDP